MHRTCHAPSHQWRSSTWTRLSRTSPRRSPKSCWLAMARRHHFVIEIFNLRSLSSKGTVCLRCRSQSVAFPIALDMCPCLVLVPICLCCIAGGISFPVIWYMPWKFLDFWSTMFSATGVWSVGVFIVHVSGNLLFSWYTRAEEHLQECPFKKV